MADLLLLSARLRAHMLIHDLTSGNHGQKTMLPCIFSDELTRAALDLDSDPHSSNNSNNVDDSTANAASASSTSTTSLL
ncbi:unnamed protein product, partial [Amoebophrya sp. A25]|eukprot:GSA25T00026442001.1